MAAQLRLRADDRPAQVCRTLPIGANDFARNVGPSMPFGRQPARLSRYAGSGARNGELPNSDT